jgi:hypothetical protein
MNVEGEIDRLYELPLDEFTAARNELAKRLTKDGDREEAARVKAQRKPTATAWAANQLAHGDEVGVRRLLSAADRLRAAQEGALSGKAAPDLRKAVRAHQDAAQTLVEEARRVVGDGVTDDVLNRLGPALLNASVDAVAREELEAGRLVREPEATGFGAFAGVPVKPSPKGRKSGAAPSRRREEAESARREKLKAARDEVRTLERKADAAARDARSAEQAAEAARKRLRRLEEKR